MPDKLTASLNKPEINYNEHKKISTGNVEPTIYTTFFFQKTLFEQDVRLVVDLHLLLNHSTQSRRN